MILQLPYTPPYHWTAMLAFLAARAVPATERIEAGVYRRTMRLGTPDDPVAGVATVSHDAHRKALTVALSPGLAKGAGEALARIGHLFDIACDPRAIAAVLGELARPDPGLRLPGAADPFELTVRAILGQQVTVAAARALATRFVARFGEVLPAATAADQAPALTHLFPTASAVAGLQVAQLGEIGIIRSRGQAIIDVAGALAAGTLQLARVARTPSGNGWVEPALASLTAIRGVGPWTAHYIAMRSLGWADAFPPGDVVARKALQAATPAAALALAEQWRPWRAYALMHLWRQAGLNAR